MRLVEKSLRTNYYQRQADGSPKPYLSVKLSSREIELFPLPRPLCEIYVYSPRMEGVHLRNGKVARGGIRWSDRKEDFRTEILALMKAQVVKNAVIVPTGSKGGFVVKRMPAARAEQQSEVVECYKTFDARLARHHRQHRGRQAGAAQGRRAQGRRRSLPRRRRRQRHRDLLRYRQRRLG